MKETHLSFSSKWTYIYKNYIFIIVTDPHSCLLLVWNSKLRGSIFSARYFMFSEFPSINKHTYIHTALVQRVCFEFWLTFHSFLICHYIIISGLFHGLIFYVWLFLFDLQPRNPSRIGKCVEFESSYTLAVAGLKEQSSWISMMLPIILKNFGVLCYSIKVEKAYHVSISQTVSLKPVFWKLL